LPLDDGNLIGETAVPSESDDGNLSD